MDRAVVAGFDPGREESVQFGEVGDVVAADDVGVAGDLDQKLLAHGPEKPLYLPPAWGWTWCEMNKPHTEFRARPQQPRIHIGRAVIDVCGLGDAAGGQR